MRMRSAILAVTTLAAGCTYATLSTRGQSVNVADAAPPGCEKLGMVIGKGGGGFGEFVPNEKLAEYAMNDARNKAAELGGTHVTLAPPSLGGNQNGTTSATVIGYAYRCGQGSAAAQAGAQPVPASAPAR